MYGGSKFNTLVVLVLFSLFLVGCTINDDFNGNVNRDPGTPRTDSIQSLDSNISTNNTLTNNLHNNDSNKENSNQVSLKITTTNNGKNSGNSGGGSSGGGSGSNTNSQQYTPPVSLSPVPVQITNTDRIDQINEQIIDNTVTESVIVERKPLMKKLLENNVEKFFDKSVVAIDESYADLSENIEQPIVLEGYLNILVSEDKAGNSIYTYNILSNNKMYNINPTDNLLQLNPELRSGSKITVSGLIIDNDIAVKTSDVKILENGPVLTIGPQKIVVFMVSFTDSQNPNPENMTSTYVKERLENGPFAKFMQEQSYGKVGNITADVYGWYQIPHNSVSSGSFSIYPPTLDDIKTYSDSLSINMTQYDRILILVNHHYFTGGTSYVGISQNKVGNEIWNTSVSWVGSININNQSTYKNPSGWGTQPFNWTNLDYLVSHELGGHGFGANHAGIMRCEPGIVMYGQACNENNLNDPYASYNYGNYYDIMGTTSFTLHTNAYYKELNGWINQSTIQSVVTNGTYTINPLESNNGIHAAKIYPIGSDPNTSTPYMYIEIRRPIGFDSKTNYSTGGWPNTKDNLNGIFVNVMNEFSSTSENFARTYLLDMTPNSIGGTSASYYDTMNVTLNVDKTYIDAPMGIRIKTLSVDNSTEGSATFEVNLTQPSCYFREPIKISADTSRVTMSIHRPYANLFNFGYTFQGKAYAGCKESHIILEPNYPESWTLEYFEKLPSGELVQFFDKTITLNETSSKNIIVYATIPRSWFGGKPYSFAPSMNVTVQEFAQTYQRLILSKYSNMSFSNDSCTTRTPIFKGVLNYAINQGESFMMPITVRNNDSSSCQDSVFLYNVTFPEGWITEVYYNTSYLYNVTLINQTTGQPYNRTIVGYRLEKWYNNKYIRRNTNSEFILFYNVTPVNAIPGTYNINVNFTNFNGAMSTLRDISINVIDPCVRNTPTIAVPSDILLRQGIDNNTVVQFNVTNNDNSYCTDAIFNITTTNPMSYQLLVYNMSTGNYVPVDVNNLTISAGVKKRLAYNVTTVSYINTTFSITAKNNDSGLSVTGIHSISFIDPCIRNNPTITINGGPFNFIDTLADVTNGTATASITNNDNIYCLPRTFTTTIEGNSAWNYIFASPTIINGGQTLVQNITFIAKQTNLTGNYDFNISVTDGSTTVKSTIPVTAAITPPIITFNAYVDSVYVDNTTPKIGQTVGVNFVIMKNENQNINNFKYTINTGQQTITRTVPVFDYPIDGWEYFNYTSAGTFNGNITIDSDNVLIETNKADNIRQFTITVVSNVLSGKLVGEIVQ
jgi:hypothetical protein